MSGLGLQLALPRLEVQLTLPGRGISAVVGESGAGKTTLLRAVAGLERDARGRVEMNGEIWQDDSAGIFLPTHQRRVGFVFQEPSLFPHLSVQKNIEYGLQRIAVIDRKIALAAVVELLGIGQLLQRAGSTLSGGEQQRVAIARALATSPSLLLMDEPLAALDEQRRAEILPYLEQLHAQLDIPILYVSHAMDEVARLADYVVVLESGKVRACGEVFDMINSVELPFGKGEHACTVVAATVLAYDSHYQLAEAQFSGGTLYLASNPVTAGSVLRLRILARDVSLSLHRQSGSSMLNSIAVTVVSVRDEPAGLASVTLDANGTALLARITRKSVHELQVVVGMSLFAQIKGVAILR